MISAALEKLSKSASYLSMFIYANVTLSDMPWDVVEERERVRLRKEKRGDLGRERERKKMGLYGKKSATLCSNLRSPVCLAAGFVCSVIRVRALSFSLSLSLCFPIMGKLP